MALRRYRRFVRRIPRRRRLRKPVRRRVLHRRRQPVLWVKLTRTIQVTQAPNVELNVPLHCQLNDFSEHINLGANFERVKVYKQVIRVLPQQNVSNTSTSRVGNYCILPYHKPVPSPFVSLPTALSVDKAKIFRGTQKGRMSFVPATRLDADSSTGNQTIRTDWRPEFEIGTTATLPILYTGMLVFENLGIALGPTSYYTIVMDLYVRYKNQRSFI